MPAAKAETVQSPFPMRCATSLFLRMFLYIGAYCVCLCVFFFSVSCEGSSNRLLPSVKSQVAAMCDRVDELEADRSGRWAWELA